MSDALTPLLAGVQRCQVQTPNGLVTYLDTDAKSALPPALLVHGVATSSLIWRNAMPLLAGHRRCIAVDLPMHGGTRVTVGPDFSLGAMAEFLADFCDALGLNDAGGRVDLIANDTGGAIAQVFAVREPDRLRSLTLTDCDTLGNLPPKAFVPTVWLARLGWLAPAARLLTRSPRLARRILLAGTYERLAHAPLPVVGTWIVRLLESKEGAARFQHWLGGMNDRELAEIDPALRTLAVPTLLVWGTRDRFFRMKWARRLQAALPGAQLSTIKGGHLFLVDERADEFAAAVGAHWVTNTPVAVRP
jgi:pimeloyl-ACP methyl ester carboxylesterase